MTTTSTISLQDKLNRYGIKTVSVWKAGSYLHIEVTSEKDAEKAARFLSMAGFRSRYFFSDTVNSWKAVGQA